MRRVLATMVPTTLLVFAVLAQGREPEEMGWIIGFTAFFGLVLAVLLVVHARQSVRPGVLRIEPEHVRWRSDMQGTADVALPYGELWVAHKEGRGDGEKLAFKGREKGLIVIPTAFFPDTDAADTALAAVRERIGLLPDGRQRLDGIAARAAVAERIRSGRQIIAPIISVLLGLVFLAELATGALAAPIRLWTFGANSAFLVIGGELFRLATANLLHASVIHLLFNVVVLVSLGAFLEPLLGRGRFLSVLLASALVGAAGSVIWGRHALSLGASTGVAGLIAAYVAILRRWPDRIANRPTKWTWITILLAFVWPSLIFENVDHAAHVAGFLAGFFLMSLETSLDPLELADRRRIGYRITAALLVALFGAAGWRAVSHARDPQHTLRDAGILARDSTIPFSIRNSLAWHIVTSPEASRDQLWHALRGVESVVEDEPETVVFRDTQATAHYRLGQWEEAVRMEHEVFADDRTPFHAAQLARFEWAHLQARGPLLLGEPPGELPQAELVSGPAVCLDAGLPRGALAHLVLAREGKASALLEVTLRAVATSGPLCFALPRDPSMPVPDQVSLALVDTRETGEPGETTHWEVWPVVPEAARLP